MNTKNGTYKKIKYSIKN